MADSDDSEDRRQDCDGQASQKPPFHDILPDDDGLISSVEVSGESSDNCEHDEKIHLADSFQASLLNKRAVNLHLGRIVQPIG